MQHDQCGPITELVIACHNDNLHGIPNQSTTRSLEKKATKRTSNKKNYAFVSGDGDEKMQQLKPLSS